jgi:hypothetical protein
MPSEHVAQLSEAISSRRGRRPPESHFPTTHPSSSGIATTSTAAAAHPTSYDGERSGGTWVICFSRGTYKHAAEKLARVEDTWALVPDILITSAGTKVGVGAAGPRCADFSV